ncbi:MAG: ABC transporter ATP-binding protein [Acidobacteria bacterium]|nr:MAG: ABC transporter ATP-binding protein [Acidobacteriota bacterium]
MIQLENVTKEYDLPTGKVGQLVAADHLTLDVPTGEVFGLVGPNGAGKTTTLKMVCGLMLPTAGRVTANNIDVERNPEAAQQYIAYLADFFSVYDDLKAWEYVEHFALAYKLDPGKVRERVKEVIALMGLESKYDAMVSGLSRGTKQRLGIARAIVHDPPLLVLNEPASGLDPKARLELKELIRRLNRGGKTVFITSHVLPELEEICTSLAIMEKRKLLRVGKIEDVMSGAGRTKRVRIKLAAAGFALGAWLARRPGVSEVKEEGLKVEMVFPGRDAELAALVRDAVNAGAPICGVEEKVESLESLFSRLSSGEVM